MIGCITKLLRFISPKAFNDGLKKSNNLGKKLIICKKHGRLLDLGCGDGKLTIEFVKIAKVKEIYGIEYINDDRKKAEEKGIKCIKSDLNYKFKFKSNFFDLILSSQNIEHLHNTRFYLEESYRCLNPGGQIIILTENLASWVNIVALFFGWMPFSTTNINGWSLGNPLIWHMNELKDEKTINKLQNSGISGLAGHVRVLSYIGLRDLLTKTGFKKVKIYSRGYLPFWGLISDILSIVDKRHSHFLIASAIKM